MPSSATIDDFDYQKFLDDFEDFQTYGVREPMGEAGKELEKNLKLNISLGQDVNGNFYPQVRQVTKQMEIAFTGPYSDTRKRNQVSDSSIAMDVTRQSFESIYSESNSDGSVEVGYEGDRQDVIFRSNAQNKGNVNKPKRDPLGLTVGIPTDFEFDEVADKIESALERLFYGV